MMKKVVWSVQRHMLQIRKKLQSMMREASFTQRLSQCELMDGNFPELIVATKYRQSSMKPCGVTALPLTFFGFKLMQISCLNSLINLTNSGRSFFYANALRFCKSFSCSVGRIKVKQFLSSKNVFSFFLMLFFHSAA
jgi:hypothetical protein